MKAYYEDKKGNIILLNEIISINLTDLYVLLRNKDKFDFTTTTEINNLIVAFKEFHDYHEARFIETHDNNIRFVKTVEIMGGGAK